MEEGRYPGPLLPIPLASPLLASSSLSSSSLRAWCRSILRNKRGVPRGAPLRFPWQPFAHCSPGVLVTRAELRMELFSVTAVAASIFLLLLFLVFISVYIVCSPGPRPLSQNC